MAFQDATAKGSDRIARQAYRRVVVRYPPWKASRDQPAQLPRPSSGWIEAFFEFGTFGSAGKPRRMRASRKTLDRPGGVSKLICASLCVRPCAFMVPLGSWAGDPLWQLSLQQVAPKNFPWFKVASFDEARKFSFECNPRKLFELNQNQLPFGCHAWQKHDSGQFT